MNTYTRIFYSIILSFFISNIFFSSAAGQDKSPPLALRGQLDLGDWDLNQDGVVRLDGTWEFYWEQFIEPFAQVSKQEYVRAPENWGDHTESPKPSKGYATFRLRVKGEFKDKNLGLFVPPMYSSHKVMINGKVIATNGKVGTSIDTYEPFWQGTVSTFTPTTETIELIVHVSNFHHSKGGFNEQFLLGTAEQIEARLAQTKMADLFKTIGLLLLTVIMTAVYFVKKRIRFLWFALFSFFWAVRGAFSSTYLIFDWFPAFNWFAAVKIEYLMMPLTLLFGILIFHKLYRSYTFSWAKTIIVSGCLLYSGLIIFGPIYWFSSTLTYFFSFLGLALFYVLVAVINTVIHEVKGSLAMTAAIILVVFLFFYDLFSYQQLIQPNPYILNIGYLLIFYLLGGSLAYFGVKKSRNKSSQ